MTKPKFSPRASPAGEPRADAQTDRAASDSATARRECIQPGGARSQRTSPDGEVSPRPPANHPNIEWHAIEALKPYGRNARTHTKKHIRQIADSIARFGFTNPVLISAEGVIIAGHGRVEAARMLGLDQVPTLELAHLTADELRAYVLADNKLALNAGWDMEILAGELEALIDLDFDISLTGFSAAEIDLTVGQAKASSVVSETADDADLVPPMADTTVSRAGDLWHLGRHCLLCGDAKSEADLDRLMTDASGRHATADLVFTDPPYNVPIDGHVCGLGSVRHHDFAEASGEMSADAFTAFLTTTLGNAARSMRDGAIAFVCMDWRHMGEVLAAGNSVFTELKNLCVWNKTNGGMGTFYRSKHELVFVFKTGSAPHTNTFGLGDTGRYRTNVWDYAGINATGRDRMVQLAMHPTVKPVALIEDAIKDCSHRGEIVLDIFGGSGSTLVAAERCGRIARVIEIDPAYCDTIIRRWQAFTGKQALHADSGTFEEVADQRLVADPASQRDGAAAGESRGAATNRPLRCAAAETPLEAPAEASAPAGKSLAEGRNSAQHRSPWMRRGT